MLQIEQTPAYHGNTALLDLGSILNERSLPFNLCGTMHTVNKNFTAVCIARGAESVATRFTLYCLNFLPWRERADLLSLTFLFVFNMSLMIVWSLLSYVLTPKDRGANDKWQVE